MSLHHQRSMQARHDIIQNSGTPAVTPAPQPLLLRFVAWFRQGRHASCGVCTPLYKGPVSVVQQRLPVRVPACIVLGKVPGWAGPGQAPGAYRATQNDERAGAGLFAGAGSGAYRVVDDVDAVLARRERGPGALVGLVAGSGVPRAVDGLHADRVHVTLRTRVKKPVINGHTIQLVGDRGMLQVL